ncbi:MAG: cisplatin damage response ATP-dependent DNA ligase, partial [Sphingomonadaceae bacterium]
MQRFARLLDQLSTSPARTAKLRLLGDYFAGTPDPDRGLALAALTGGLDLPAVKPALVRALIEARVDPLLFRLSHDYVGDLAETVSLLWPAPALARPAPSLAESVEALRTATRATAPAILADLLDRLDASGRFALLKLATGAMRVGAGARLVRIALAERFALPLAELEEVWHGLAPPYESLFAWAEGRGPRPDPGPGALFRPFMLAHPLDDPATLDLSAHALEWKWDGIRAQAVSTGSERRLFSRDGNDISESFPDLVAAICGRFVLDGELLVRGADGEPASFNALQQRLGRKAPTARLMAASPVFLRAYDLLFVGEEDLRPRPFEERRARLETLLASLDPARFDLSPLVPAESLAELARLRADPPHPAIEGLMLKRRDSPYVAGRVTGLWWKWKKDPMTADCVLMYAQRGHGKRSSFYSDFTFGAWGPDGTLLPVGKAYFGFTDEELRWLDRWVREHTMARFGPVREVEKSLVLEIA